MKKTSENILSHLYGNGSSTVLEISEALLLTKADIRYHLALLLREKRVGLGLPSSVQTPGRPAQRFIAFEVVNRHLVLKLIEGYEGSLKTKGIPPDEVAGNLAKTLLSGFSPEGSLPTKLNQAVHFLAEMGIQTKWEAGNKGPRITISTSLLVSAELAIEIKKLLLDSILSKN
jgi:hypothetical protein